MLISCPTEFLDARLGGIDRAIELLAKAGFDAYDFTFWKMNEPDHFMNQENWRAEILKCKETADRVGIVCNQSHAPFPSSVGDAEKDEIIFEQIVRSMEGAAILGAKCIVVHPKQHLCYAERAAELKQMNLEFYSRLIPYAEKFGIKIATENMWQWNKHAKHPIDSTCSRVPEFCEYIDMINSPYLIGCLDIGHVFLTGADLGDFIRTMGKDRLQALHVHDNDFLHDSHTLPYLLNIDFSEMTAALREIGYEGDLTFEANSFFKRIPDPLLPAAASYMCEVGKYLASQIQKA